MSPLLLLGAASASAALALACSAAPPVQQPCTQTVSIPTAGGPPLASASPSPSASASVSAPVSAPPKTADGRPPAQAPRSASGLGFCTPDEERAAHAEIDALGALVLALPGDASPATPATDRIAKLYGSPCYRGGALARGLDAPKLKAALAWSVKKWWTNEGQLFLRDSLEHANAIHFAPSIPPMLAAEALAASDPLRAIVCPAFGAACDPVAQGAALDLGREAERVGLRAARRGTETAAATEESCAQAATKVAMESRLVTFVGCVHDLVPLGGPVPEARYRSPRGWLVLRGRRGHYGFCDEARAYDLDTGAAYIASRCGGLVLQSSGSVNQDATRATGAVKTQVGTLSVDALRKVGLALWLKEKLNGDVRRYAKFALPVAVPMPEPNRGFGFGRGGWAHSGQTTIRFEITDAGGTLLAGDFRWPDASQTGDQVVDDLVVSAETTLREGCPPAALPASLAPASSLGGVSSIDASADALQKTAAELADAFVKLRKTKVCKVAATAKR